jgi:3-hydroxyacyl-CoA dehydrogenase
MINEGFKILAEGKAIRASDIDVIWVKGYGWPVYRGGPMFYGEQIGFAHVLERLKEFQKNLGDAFAPAPLLERAVAEGQSCRELGF